MLVYVSHKYQGKEINLQKAKQITHALQINDLENVYICPLLTLSHMAYNEIGYDEEMALRIDILSVCDKMIVASDDTSKDTKEEIEFAEMVGMEVEYLD